MGAAGLVDAQTVAGLVDAQTVAETLGVSRAYVYEHAAQLGAMRLPGAENGAGKVAKPRLRFDLEDVKRRISYYASRESELTNPAPQAASRPHRRRRSGTNVDLLPIRGCSPDA